MAKIVIFDFDMTLADSVGAINWGFNQIADHFGLRRIGRAELLSVLSLTNEELWPALWGRSDPAWYQYLIEKVADEEDKRVKLAPGATGLLADLKRAGAQLAMASNRDHPWRALVSTGIAGYFDTAAGCLDVPRGKPAPDMLNLILERLGGDAAEAIYVGDSPCDMEAARAAGMRGLGLTFGGQAREALMAAGAWLTCEDLIKARPLLGL